MSFDVDIWGTVADWVIVFSAIGGFVFAGRQLAQNVVAARDQVELERANLLLRLDEKFEGAELLESRKAWVALRSRFENEARAAGGLHPEGQVAYVSAAISKHFTELWTKVSQESASGTSGKSTEEYLVLMRLASWIETLGHLCRRNLIPDEDILDLYDHVIIRTIGYLTDHIRYRATQGPVTTNRLLENALWLCVQAHQFKKKREEPPLASPSRSMLRWKAR